MQRRIKIVMANMKAYDKHLIDGDHEDPNVHHILLSNCHIHKEWIEISIECMIKEYKDTLMIGVDC